MTAPPLPSSPAPASIRLAVPAHRVWVTWLLIAINVAVLILMEMNGGSVRTSTLIAFGAKVNTLINAGQVWRLFTSMFLHIGLIHLAVNCFSLYNIGTLLERFIGSLRFVVLYVLAGLCGGLASYWFSPRSISAGASGAIFGLLGALAVFFYLHRALFGKTANRILTNVALVALVNLGLGASIPGIDNFAHVGGLLGGIIVGALISPRYSVVMDSSGQPTVSESKSIVTWVSVALFAAALAFLVALAVGSGGHG
jgi:rhomboid protease GluP